jgi:hypothetical protein
MCSAFQKMIWVTGYVVTWDSDWTESILKRRDAYGPSGLLEGVGRLHLDPGLADGALRLTARTSEIFAIRIPNQANDLTIGHARKMVQFPKRRMVRKALSKSCSHPSLRGRAAHGCVDGD